MFESIPGDVTVRIQAASRQLSALTETRPYSAGRLGGSGRIESTTVLVRGAHAPDVDARVSTVDAIVLPVDVDPATALMVPPLASALAIWRTLQLELGEVALWTGGSPLSALVGRVALWSGGCPAIELGPGTPDDRTKNERTPIRVVDWSEAEAAQTALIETVADKPGFAAVDLSGRADVIDTLLEVIPRWGRLLLAGPPGTPVTIDFYKNVHRKGIVMPSMILEPTAIFETSGAAAGQISRAIAILRNRMTADECRRVLGVSHEAPISLAG